MRNFARRLGGLRRWFGEWRVELAGSAVVGSLAISALLSSGFLAVWGLLPSQAMAQTSLVYSYCYSNLRCNGSYGCSQTSVCASNGAACGNYYTGTNIPTCSSTFFNYSCNVSPGSYACWNIYQCVCSYNSSNGSWTCGQGNTYLGVGGYAYNICT